MQQENLYLYRFMIECVCGCVCECVNTRACMHVTMNGEKEQERKGSGLFPFGI